MLNINEPLPPRPPVPNVNIDLTESTERVKRARRRGGPVRFFIKIALLAALVFAVYWAVQQPFFEPAMDKAILFAKRAFNWLKESIKNVLSRI